MLLNRIFGVKILEVGQEGGSLAGFSEIGLINTKKKKSSKKRLLFSTIHIAAIFDYASYCDINVEVEQFFA